MCATHSCSRQTRDNLKRSCSDACHMAGYMLERCRRDAAPHKRCANNLVLSIEYTAKEFHACMPLMLLWTACCIEVIVACLNADLMYVCMVVHSCLLQLSFFSFVVMQCMECVLQCHVLVCLMPTMSTVV